MSEDKEKQREQTVERPLVLSFCNVDDEGFYNYKSSLTQHGHDFEVLGQTSKWVSFVDSKIRSVYKRVLKEESLNPSRLICVTDATDVLCLTDPFETIKVFESFESEIVAGCEDVCVPVNCIPEQKSLFKNVPPHVHRYKYYMNGGFYMGYCYAIRKMLEEVLEEGIKDDQLCLGKFHIRNYLKRTSEGLYKIVLDHQSRLAHNILVFANSFSVSKTEKRITTEHGTKPCFVHIIGRFRFNQIASQVLDDYRLIPFWTVIMYNIKKIRVVLLYVVFLLLVVLGFWFCRRRGGEGGGEGEKKI